MKIVINPAEIRIKPTEKKLKRAATFAKAVGETILPKELPLEKDIYIKTADEEFDAVKSRIQLAVERIVSAK